MKLNPYIKPKFGSTFFVMLDVIIALLPMVAMSWLAFGMKALAVTAVSVAVCLLTDIVFSAVILKRIQLSFDLSAVITGLLLAFTISPVTPLYVVAFGAVMAIFFGKIVWGGTGKNKFNPALVGRELMTVFFASVMTSSSIWNTKNFININTSELFSSIGLNSNSSYWESLLYKTSGAIGEYSAVCIALGGLYLLLRKRISWHIPSAIFIVFILLSWIISYEGDFKFSISGLLLGAIFMATDMPSSPISMKGKLFYGSMIGCIAFAFILGGISNEYMSYSILLLNGFSPKINELFKPTAWGNKIEYRSFIENISKLILIIFVFAFAIISLYHYQMIKYVVYLYIVFTVVKFNYSFSKKINSPI
ncbi:RnfABCDGE type electron transport complex subunit D [Chryseobacterium sp.]|uniref:RnfABCDGE type electron transport complex subunit D n=1 Tax=Chryseobacterium sp. TaxID=1871047 RepID=UPI0028978C5B|nr:RnfABCDGE type electron transport complex subunit D [Chryseobacterium sp.]